MSKSAGAQALAGREFMGYIPTKRARSDRMSIYEEVSASLADWLGNRCNASGIAECTVSLWQRVQEDLTPLFGSGPMALLYEQSLAAARARHPWLPGGVGCADEPPVMDTRNLWLALAGQSPEAAREGAALTLYSFCRLLESLIGGRLAWLVLRPVFARPRSQAL